MSARVRILSNVTQDDLPAIYQGSSLFVYPSFFEGFGIPILESFACACPLVCSNTSSLPEIAGNAAQYFDPYSKESMYNAISEVLNDKNLSSTLVKKGKERLKLFSWKKTAIETKKIYESVL